MKSNGQTRQNAADGPEADDLISVVIALDRYKDDEIDIVTARQMIMPLFALPSDDCAHRDLVDYLDRQLDHLRIGDLSSDAVLNDIVSRAAISP